MSAFDQVKMFFKPTDIYTSQRLMLYVLNFAGFVPLRISGNENNRRLNISKIGFAFAIIFVVLNLACFGLTYVHSSLLVVVFHTSLLSDFGGSLEFVTMFVLMAVLYISSMSSRKKISACMNSIANIDRKLKLIGIEINYWKGFNYSLLMLTCFVTVHLAFTLIMKFFSNKKMVVLYPQLGLDIWATTVTHHMSVVAMSLINSHFACIAFELKKRFEAINRVRYSFVRALQILACNSYFTCRCLNHMNRDMAPNMNQSNQLHGISEMYPICINWWRIYASFIAIFVTLVPLPRTILV